jgi:phosphate transporter
MPVSGFPNQTAWVCLPSSQILAYLTATKSATQEDELGQLYLSNVDFLKNGVPASIVAAFVSDFCGNSGIWI